MDSQRTAFSRPENKNEINALWVIEPEGVCPLQKVHVLQGLLTNSYKYLCIATRTVKQIDTLTITKVGCKPLDLQPLDQVFGAKSEFPTDVTSHCVDDLQMSTP